MVKILVRVVEELEYSAANRAQCTRRSLQISRADPERPSRSGFLGSLDLSTQPIPAHLAASLPVWSIHRMGDHAVSHGHDAVVASPELLTWLRTQHREWPTLQSRLDEAYGGRLHLHPKGFSATA